MIPFFPIPPAIAAAALSVLISGGSIRTSSVPAGAPVAFQAEDPNIRCAAGRATSRAIPFERVIPHRVEHERPSDEYALRRGPRMLVVVDDSTQWPAIWHAAVDSVRTPSMAFGNAVLVLATTQYWLVNPLEFRITSIRQCRSTGFIVVSTIETYIRSVTTGMWSRHVDLIRVPGRKLAQHPVIFDQRLRYVP